MKIYRDEKEIELTNKELIDAYREQEKIFDISDIENTMENYLDDEEYEILIGNNEFIKKAANEMRKNIDKNDMFWSDAATRAINDLKNEYLGLSF